MKRFLAPFALAAVIAISFCMSGCGVVQAKFNADVQAATKPDVQAAIDMAKAVGDQDGVDCWTQVYQYIDALPTTAADHPLPTILGIASGIEAARAVANTPAPSFPPVPAALHKACAVLAIDAQQLALKFGIQAAAFKSGVGVIKAGAALKGEAAALSKEATAIGAH